MPLIPVVLLGRAACWFDVEAIEDTCFRYVDLDLTMADQEANYKESEEVQRQIAQAVNTYFPNVSLVKEELLKEKELEKW